VEYTKRKQVKLEECVTKMVGVYDFVEEFRDLDRDKVNSLLFLSLHHHYKYDSTIYAYFGGLINKQKIPKIDPLLSKDVKVEILQTTREHEIKAKLFAESFPIAQQAIRQVEKQNDCGMGLIMRRPLEAKGYVSLAYNYLKEGDLEKV